MLKISSLLMCRRLNVKHLYSVTSFRSLSFKQLLRRGSVLLDKSSHDVIYEFPYIKQLSYYIRTKFWVPGLITAVAPVGILFEDIRFTILGGVVAGCIHGGIVHMISLFFHNTIGKIYVNKNNEAEDVIISTVDKSGNRIDRYHKPQDIIVCEFSTKIAHSMGFINVYVNNTDLIYQLNVISGVIHNKKQFTNLIGQKWTVLNNEKTG